MAKLYTVTHLVLVRTDEEARNRNWVTDQEDYVVRDLGRGLWSVRAMDIDGGLGRPRHFRTAEFERIFLRRPEVEVYAYKL